MGEKFEVRLMELMLERARFDWSQYGESHYKIEPWEAIECVRKMLNEFEAVVYQP